MNLRNDRGYRVALVRCCHRLRWMYATAPGAEEIRLTRREARELATELVLRDLFIRGAAFKFSVETGDVFMGVPIVVTE